MAFDLVEYARAHRYRLRDLSLGGPCPPAMWKPPDDYERPTGLRETERQWIIPGRIGYVSDDGADNVVGIYLYGIKGQRQIQAIKTIHQLGGTVPQIGDDEIAGYVPVSRIEDALKLIRASKLKKPNDPTGSTLNTWRQNIRTKASQESRIDANASAGHFPHPERKEGLEPC